MLAVADLQAQLARIDIAAAALDKLRSAGWECDGLHGASLAPECYSSRFRGRAIPYSSSRLISVRREMPSSSAARVWLPAHLSSASRMRCFSSSATVARTCDGMSADSIEPGGGVVGER